MPTTIRANDALRRALADKRLRERDVAEALRVDPKTVQRWLSGRRPQPPHRWALAELTGVHEYDLWPEAGDGSGIRPEIVATWSMRSQVPRDVWHHLFAGAEHEINILVYSGLFLADDSDLVRLIGEKAAAGVIVRILLGDPDCTQVAARGAEEGIGDAMASKIRNALVLYQPILDVPGVEVRLHSTVLYSSLYRSDDDLLVNQHVYGIGAARSPVLRLGRQPDPRLFDTYAACFEQIWVSASPRTI
jgi:transcriptional regulator with XRE-family HTH domain